MIKFFKILIQQSGKCKQALKRRLAQCALLLLHSTFFILHSAFCIAQDIKVSATLDTNQIKIGEQFGLTLSATVPPGTKLFFPAIPDSLSKLEVVQRSKIDTLKSADGKLNTFQQKLTMTCFDSGYYVLEPIPFYFQQPGKPLTDSAFTEAMLLSVKTIPVDTTKAIKDIKATLDVPFTFREFLPYILWALAAFVFIMFVLYLTRKLKKNVVEVKPKIPARPAHEIAEEELKKTEAEKLWQQGYFKKYHSSVSDIVRMYIEHRFGINAMELTSDETLEHFRGNLINEEAKEKLRYILQLADMVKFAKVQPIGNENEQSMNYAYNFVLLTKTVTPDDFKEKAEPEVAP